MSVRILEGDCLSVMPTLEAESIDAVVCDPPYGLKFMGKQWDHGVPGVPFWDAALRVAKPGAHLVAFGGTRTFHRLTCAIEDAGWEIRDCLMWLYGSGFPKSLDVSKAIDKAAGAERRVVGSKLGQPGYSLSPDKGRGTYSADGRDSAVECAVTAPTTDAAIKWQGWGTALKPSWEPIILARKPLIGTVASNVLEHSTGAINIDGCRIAGVIPKTIHGATNGDNIGQLKSRPVSESNPHDAGRWPANLILDEESAALLDEQTESSIHSAGAARGGGLATEAGCSAFFGKRQGESNGTRFGDAGGASRFFYTAKASRSEREAGLDKHPLRVGGVGDDRPSGSMHERAGDGRAIHVRNNHPTVKPLDLMQWLCRLVTPKGGLLLDPFCGSGTTGRAAVAEGFQFIGIEKSPEYAAIARARITEYAPLFGDVA